MSYSDLPGWFDYADVYDLAVKQAANFDICVEIGVGFGRSISYLARQAITACKRLRVYGVDPCVDDWASDKPTWGANHADWARGMGGPFNALVGGMREHAKEELEYVNLLRCRSVQAAEMFEDGSLFFVFVDGSHHYLDVAADLSAWERKIRTGGIFAGHDHTESFPGVQRAVGERWNDGATEQIGACWFRRVT